MVFDLEPVQAFNLLAGALLVAVAAWVASVRPRRRGNMALAVFSGAFGLGWAGNYALGVVDAAAVDSALRAVVAVGLVAAGAAVVELARVAPPPRAEDRPALASAAAAGAVLVAALVLNFDEYAAGQSGAIGAVPRIVLLGGFLTALVLFAVRFRRYSREGDEAGCRVAATLSLPLVLYLGVVAGVYSAAFTGPVRFVAFGGLVLVAVLWLRNAADAAGPARGWSRNLALVALALPVANHVLIRVVGGSAGGQWVPAFVRIATALVLTYAILRHQLLGLDVRVKWTLKQSTVAAAFVGVFFVVSESAARFFESSVGPYVGIAAAGALVFAIHPLQHLAQRVADRAMPDVESVGEIGEEERNGIYLALARAAWSDGVLSREERALLDAAQRRLGIPSDVAMRIEQDAARPA